MLFHICVLSQTNEFIIVLLLYLDNNYTNRIMEKQSCELFFNLTLRVIMSHITVLFQSMALLNFFLVKWIF